MSIVFFPEFVGGVLDGKPSQTAPTDVRVLCVPGRPPGDYFSGGWQTTEKYVRREIGMASSNLRLHAWVDVNLPPSHYESEIWHKLLSRAGCVRAQEQGRPVRARALA